MAGLNKIILIGNVGTDPEMRYTPKGDPVTSFRLASTRSYTTNGERRDETEWFTVVAWRQLAETCNQYLTKGRQVYVEGRLRSRTWEGKDGQTRFQNEVNANVVLFLGRPPSTGAAEGGTPAEEEGDDLPFDGGDGQDKSRA
ncbi:MAG: single-stranded DNA-binding protein [Chloroflexi bacterium]|nr:single-stranded DNA-binding protein [Chloroflexota bacterium]